MGRRSYPAEICQRVLDLIAAGRRGEGFLPQLIDLIWNRAVDPGKVLDLTLQLDRVAECYRAMNERRAIKRCCGPDAESIDLTARSKRSRPQWPLTRS